MRQPLWGRRSVFNYQEYKMMIAEVFFVMCSPLERIKRRPFWGGCSSLTIICYNTIPRHLVSVTVYDVW